jgi:hypothetical protein
MRPPKRVKGHSASKPLAQPIRTIRKYFRERKNTERRMELSMNTDKGRVAHPSWHTGQPFDELAMGLESGAISRGKAIKLGGAALVASALGALVAAPKAEALEAERSRCCRHRGNNSCRQCCRGERKPCCGRHGCRCCRHEQNCRSGRCTRHD